MCPDTLFVASVDSFLFCIYPLNASRQAGESAEDRGEWESASEDCLMNDKV